MSLADSLLELVRANPMGTFAYGVLIAVIAGWLFGRSYQSLDPGSKVLYGAFMGAVTWGFILITGAVLRIWVLVG